MPNETALVVLVPEAESLVGSFRTRYDRSAASGVPAHVTALYPFLAPERLTAQELASLRAFLADLPGFTVTFSKFGRFSEVLYLAPEPAAPLRRLTEALLVRYPQLQPYGGAFDEIIPHLTVAHLDGPLDLDAVEAEIAAPAGRLLPIRTAVRAVSLLAEDDGRWVLREQFPLAAEQTRGFERP